MHFDKSACNVTTKESLKMKKATFFNVAFKFWLPDLDSNQGPAD